MGYLVLITATVFACCGWSAIQTVFLSPGLPAAQSPAQRLVHAEAKDGFLHAESAPIDASVGGSSGMWAGAFASFLGAAAAISGLRGSKSTAKRMPRRGVVMNAGPNALDQLKKMTTVVADTGVLEEIKKFKPTDATTNPTLVLRALSGPDAKSYFDRAIAGAAAAGLKVGTTDTETLVEDICDRLAVLLGSAILGYVPGVVSTEVDARLSFSTEAMIAKGRKISKLYQEQGHGKDKVLVKLASTWEAMEACRTLQAEGIRCNMTLVLSLPQAVAAAEANATLISPFVGRILDWYKNANNCDYTPEEDPGVKSVGEIFNYYKSFGYDTIVMGASFRSAHEVLALSGCDKMTISPNILSDIEALHIQVDKKLDGSKSHPVDRLQEGGLDEEHFRWHLNEDPMATELLAKGIRSFAVDGVKLEDLVRARLVA